MIASGGMKVLKRAFAIVLSLILGLVSMSPASGATYPSKLNLNYGGNEVTLRLSQAGELVDEAYEYDLGTSHWVFGSIIAGVPIDLEIESTQSESWIIPDFPTTSCEIEVGVGFGSGRLLEEDPAQLLGSVPVTISLEPKDFPDPGLQLGYLWTISGSGQVPGPALSAIGKYSNLTLNLVCSGQVVHPMGWTLSDGIVGKPYVPDPSLSGSKDSVSLNLGNFDSYSSTAAVMVVFEVCDRPSQVDCEQIGLHEYLAYQIIGPLPFTISGVDDAYLRARVAIANDYGASSATSNLLRIGNPPSDTSPAVAHLKGHGPNDGEFSAWTKVLANGTQMKFYAKYLQPGQKVQFMVQNSSGAYEQVAWKRVTEGDLADDGAYTNLQNHVYFIRTIDLRAGKNRVRILVDGEIVWGTKTYTLK